MIKILLFIFLLLVAGCTSPADQQAAFAAWLSCTDNHPAQDC